MLSTDAKVKARTSWLGHKQVPAGIDAVVIRAHDSVHGYGGAERRVTLP